MSSDAYACWAPEGGPWSPWVKPVLFAQEVSFLQDAAAPIASDAVAHLPAGDSDAFVVVDCPGHQSVSVGMALARRGYRPVPLFNGVHAESAIVATRPIIASLRREAAELAALGLRIDAPPAFLLDSDRLNGLPLPGQFDNRWVVVPEDFPSANRLLAAGLRRCILLGAGSHPDLPHVLLRYRDAGVTLLKAHLGAVPSEYRPTRPSSFRLLFARVLVASGLRRSSAGGFGGAVPAPTEGGYSGYG